MRVIPPLAITEARLTSSTAPEPGVGEQAYNGGSTYALGDRVILGSPTSTVTITVASPAVVSWASNGMVDGTPVVLTTTGALPTGLTAGALYYVRRPLSGTLNLSLTPGGVPIVTTGSQSGTHTITAQVHRTFESLQAGNTGHYPLTDAYSATPTWWKDVGPTNKWAMFDLVRNSQTELATSPLTVALTPGQRVDAIAVLGLEATSAQISITSGGSPVYDSGVLDLTDRDVTDWYGYFFADFASKPSAVLFDLPPITNAVITVALSNNSGPVKCGACVIGSQVYLGSTELSAANDTLNFSAVTRDANGNATMVQRRNVPKTVQRVFTDAALVNTARTLRDLLNAVPAVWSGLDEESASQYFEALLILGFYRRFTINAEHPVHAVIDLELEEV